MMKLRLQVPTDRDSTAFATLTDGGHTLGFDDAAASASVIVAKKNGNADCDPLRPGGHPPLGTYRLLQTQPLDDTQRGEYGAHALVFEPMSGPALEAESFGRLGLLVYGGRAGKDGRLRRTQGGVRLTDLLLDRLVAALRPGVDLTLELAAIKAPSWWAFWRKAVPTRPLSAEPPGSLAPPLDEATLLAALLASAPRRPRTSRDDADWRDDDRRTRESSTSSGSGESFKGGGGEFGGAGASGRWDAAPAGSGVDRTGMIVAGAAGVAAAGIAAAAGASGNETASLTDTGTAY